ncbi:MAG: IS1182 family transposase [Dehalococcoidales bacterium]|nr:IS1182 family transposase [Dehalococcoidales bacterium]
MIGTEYKAYMIDTGYLFPPSLADFLGSKDEVHIFREVTEQLEIGSLDGNFGGMGQHPYHPLMLLRLLVWGMANRVVSTRKIEVLARRDVSFIYLAGGQKPDFRTLARFRRRNAKEIEKLFKETVLLCARLGMVNLGHVALDGTKLKANTSKHKAMSYGRMKQEEEKLKKQIEELMRQAETTDAEEDKTYGTDSNGYNLPEELQRRENRLEKIRSLREELEKEKREEQQLKEDQSPVIADKEQRSFADRKARMMLMKRGEFDYGYNAQACTAEGHGVIVAAALTNEAADTGHLPDMVQQVRQLRDDLGLEKEEKTAISSDTGYFSVENIKKEGKGIELLIASGRERKEKPVPDKGVYSIERFEYIKQNDSWRCPGDRLLVREKKSVSKGRPLLRRYVCRDCAGCTLSAHCLKSGEERRTLLVKRKQLVGAEMRARLKQPKKQAIYCKRKWVAEQIFGQIKEGFGFRGVTVRGEEYARAQWLFTCAVHNVMKAVRYISGDRKDTGKQGAVTLAIA